MLFNSYVFIFIFLPIVLGAFFACCYFQLKKVAQLSLFISSLAFYAYWDIRFLPLLCGSIIFNYVFGNLIYKTSESNLRRIYLIFGIVMNLSFLFYFKYLNFFISSINSLFPVEMNIMEIVLPLGISFFTFTQIAYLVDVYQSKAVPGGWDSYGLFVTVFPHLIAGPVLHHKDMISQFEDVKNYSWSSYNFALGTFLFVMGLTKKVLLADQVSPFVSPIFDKGQTFIPFIQAWVGSIAYAVELYFDFSGYSDMAMGLGLFFNINLPLNFQSPFQASSMIDFWRRWHISLSNFLKNYLYIPLGGNKYGERSKLRNLLITMFLGGIWHGANWTFVFWGVCQGCLLMINHLWRKFHISMPNLLAHIITFLCIIFTFAIFRSPNLEVAYDVIKGMLGFNGIILPESYEQKLAFLSNYGIIFKTLSFSNARLTDLIMIFGALCATLLLPNSFYWKERFLRQPILWGALSSAAFVTCVLNLDAVTEFLYYQF